MMRATILLALTLVLAFPAVPLANDAAIDAAIEFLQTACVNNGSRSNIEVHGSIDASLRGLKSSLLQGKATYTKDEISGLSATLNEYSSKQASEARQCMQPYIKQIIDIILKNNIGQPSSLSDEEMKSTGMRYSPTRSRSPGHSSTTLIRQDGTRTVINRHSRFQPTD